MLTQQAASVYVWQILCCGAEMRVSRGASPGNNSKTIQRVVARACNPLSGAIRIVQGYTGAVFLQRHLIFWRLG